MQRTDTPLPPVRDEPITGFLDTALDQQYQNDDVEYGEAAKDRDFDSRIRVGVNGIQVIANEYGARQDKKAKVGNGRDREDHIPKC